MGFEWNLARCSPHQPEVQNPTFGHVTLRSRSNLEVNSHIWCPLHNFAVPDGIWMKLGTDVDLINPKCRSQLSTISLAVKAIYMEVKGRAGETPVFASKTCLVLTFYFFVAFLQYLLLCRCFIVLSRCKPNNNIFCCCWGGWIFRNWWICRNRKSLHLSSCLNYNCETYLTKNDEVVHAVSRWVIFR